MTRIRRRASVIVLFAAALCTFAEPNTARTVAVSDAEELIRAIAPDRTIVLEKGEYLLSSAYGVASDYVKWIEAGDGKELCLSGLDNVTIRGVDGARLVSDSASASIVGVYDSKSVAFDNVAFARLTPGGSEASAGSFYAEAVSGLVLDRCAFEGSTTTAVELWGCEDVSIRRCDISGATSGALSASIIGGLVLSASRVSGCAGYPLLYFDESGGAVVEGTRFEGNKGGTFVEVRAEDQGADTVRFADCVFDGNEVDYFSGSEILPSTESCHFAGNSFAADWATESVAPAGEKEYSPAKEEPRWYEHSSGLSFSYPAEWKIVEYDRESRVGVFAPDGESLILFLVAYHVPANVDPAAATKAAVVRLFADSAIALAKRLKEGTGITLAIEADGEPYTGNELLSADYRGWATKGQGERAAVRARFIASEGLVCAMVGIAADPSSLETESEIDGIFSSIVRTTTRDGE
jgi:Right handed beta helix region